jgi:hypothetical protein
MALILDLADPLNGALSQGSCLRHCLTKASRHPGYRYITLYRAFLSAVYRSKPRT